VTEPQKLSESLVALADYLLDVFPYDIRMMRVIRQLDVAADKAVTLEQIEGYWRQSVDASWTNTGTILRAVLAGVELGKREK
jgi:hypothetical protein